MILYRLFKIKSIITHLDHMAHGIAQRGKKIPEVVADELIAKAQEIIIILNRKK